MKKYILLLLFIIGYTKFYSQENLLVSVNAAEPSLKITGFGRLKLGMSIADLAELKDAKIMTSENDFISKVFQNDNNKTVYEQIADSTKFEPMFGSLVKKVRVFTVPTLNVTDEIVLNGITLKFDVVLKFVTLKFYDDKLYFIQCEDVQSLIEALTLKYGEPKEEEKEEEKENDIHLAYKVLTSNWNTGDNNIVCQKCLLIHSTGIDNYTFDGGVHGTTNDESIILSFILLFDSSIDTSVNDCQNELLSLKN